MLRVKESGYLNRVSPMTKSLVLIEIVPGTGSFIAWTPASGKSVLLKGFRISGMVTAGFTAATFVAQFLSFGNQAHGTIATIGLPIYPFESDPPAGYQFVTSETEMGDGIDFGVNGVVSLRFDAVPTAAQSPTGKIKIKGVIWGEEV